MAADSGEVASLRHAKERCYLLIRINSTVESLIASGSKSDWLACGGLSKITEDLEHIFRHGLRDRQGTLEERNDYSIFINSPVTLHPDSFPTQFSPDGNNAEKVTVSAGQAWLQQALLDHCLSSHLVRLVDNREHLQDCYLEYAFLRSERYVQALCTCLQAIERGEPRLLRQLDHVLLNKPKNITQWLKESADFEAGLLPSSVSHDIVVEKPHSDLIHNHSTSSQIEVVYSDSTGSDKDEFQSTSSHGSPRDDQIDITDLSLNFNGQGFQTYSAEAGQNFSYLPKHIHEDYISESDGKSGLMQEEIVLGRKGLALPEHRTIDPLKKKPGLRATLAHAALSAVLESDELASSPVTWFDGNNTEHFHQLRRTNSLNDNLLRTHSESGTSDRERKLKSSTLPLPGTKFHEKTFASLTGTVIEVKEKRRDMTAHQKKKAIGHNRSKSDQLGVTKSRRQGQDVIVEVKEKKERKHRNSFSDVARLSSSLPTGTESLYYNDPLLEDPYEEQSLATILASQDFSSCELDKENAHFSISEALIAAIEQMKCDDVESSEEEDEEEEDDEEILHLKEAIEKKRQEKKHGRHVLDQAAFSDGTTQSTNSDPSMGTESSQSLWESDDDLGPDWEEITTTDEHLQQYDHDFSTSTTTLVSDPDTPAELTQSPPLSAETVAKSLLQKFAKRKHPAASELQWLVSFQDAPQSLLPLPQTVAVAPDDAVDKEATKHKAISRQNSLPCRMRGNLEWAPPRAQIIFHAHNPPRRKELMMLQNYRCAGCGMAVAPDYMKRFRYCHYVGKYFCSSCHNNCLAVIPAKVIRKWDFRKYEVSNFARDLLNRIHYDPLFNIMDLNRALYKRVRVLDELKDVRRQLHFFGTFIQTCRKGHELSEEFSKLPDHICREPSLYSMHDLLQARDGSLILFLKKLGKSSLNHINQCQLCLAKGFICEYCKNGDDIIFPFELDRVVQCPECRASFHKDCFVEGKCPKCERIRIRKQMIAEPVSPDSETSDDDPLHTLTPCLV